MDTFSLRVLTASLVGVATVAAGPYVILIVGVVIKRLYGLRSRAWASLQAEETKMSAHNGKLRRQDYGNKKRSAGQKALLAGDPIGWSRSARVRMRSTHRTYATRQQRWFGTNSHAPAPVFLRRALFT